MEVSEKIAPTMFITIANVFIHSALLKNIVKPICVEELYKLQDILHIFTVYNRGIIKIEIRTHVCNKNVIRF